MTNFQLLVLSPKMLKFQIPISRFREGGGGQFSTFDAESKFAKSKKKFKRGFAGTFLSFQAK